jgi:uncharacterized protein YegP (UPF0339 family)
LAAAPTSSRHTPTARSAKPSPSTSPAASVQPKSSSVSQHYFRIVFRIVARSDRTLCHSERYWNKADCRNAIAIIQGGAGSAPVEDLT